MNRLLLFIFVLVATVSIFGQESNEIIKLDAPNIYVDCQRCDIDFIREQIDFVNYVWDRNNADVHILFSKLKTGGGGREYTLTFIGKKKFLNINDTLKYSIIESETDDDARNKMVKAIKLGLIKYISKTPIAENIIISYKKTDSKNDKETNNDEWDYWVFRTRLNGWVNGDKSTNSLSLWGSISANRITDDLKFKLSLIGSYYENNFDFDNDTYTSISRRQGIRLSFIKSYTDHWSYGLFTNLTSSIYSNLDLSIILAPGLEYNFFPYSESTRRQLRITYKVYSGYNNYDEETVYLKEKEFLFSERLSISLDLVQPWGNIETSLSGAHFFHDLSLNSVQLSSEFRINVTKGLTIDLYGRLAYIHDQISLPRRGVNLEEVLLRQKQLETNYEYWANFGFTYSFGSIYNNIVNTRFGN